MVKPLVSHYYRMLSLEEIRLPKYPKSHCDLDLWSWKSLGFSFLRRTNSTEFGQNPFKDVQSRASVHKEIRPPKYTSPIVTLKINRVPDLDIKFG